MKSDASEASLEKRIAALEARNRRVEADKAWETSLVRRVAIAGLTYFVVVAYLYFVIKTDPWLNALIPVGGFLLSTLTLGLIKKLWDTQR